MFFAGEILVSFLLLGLATARFPNVVYKPFQNKPTSERNVCENKIGGIVADPESCHKFIICVLYTEMSSVSCNVGEIYSGSTCRPGDPKTCSLESFTTVSPEISTDLATETSSTPSTVAPGIDLEQICDGVFFAPRAYQDCAMFVGCIQGYGTIFNCKENEIFDPINLICIEGDRFAVSITEHTWHKVFLSLYNLN